MELQQEEADNQDQQQSAVQELRDVMLHLAVLATHTGQPLHYNVYFDNKLIAEKGREVTERMVARMRLLDPTRLSFRNS